MSDTEIEWAIDYHDGCGPRTVESEWRAKTWRDHYNAHRLNKDDAEATVLSRTVTTTPWTTDTTPTAIGDDE